MGNQRALFRLALKRRGELRRGVHTAACDVVDLTEKGVQLQTAIPVETGETWQLKFELSPARTIHCTIHVTRVNGSCIGARISEISPDDQECLTHFIEQLIAMNLGGV